MANNCLKTQLKSVVNNDNLEYFDSMRIKVTDWSLTRLQITEPGKFIIGGPGVVVKVLSNGNIYHGLDILDGKDLTLPQTLESTYYIRPEDDMNPTDIIFVGIARMVSTSNIGDLSYIYSTTTDSIKYMSNWAPYTTQDGKKRLSIYKSSVDNSIRTNTDDYKDLDKSTVTEIICIADSLIGDVNFIADAVSLPAINFNNNSRLGGVLASLGALTSLVEIQIYGTLISGTVEDFVAAQVAAGRTSGVIKQLNSNGLITFNGASISEGRYHITWTSESDITVGNGYLPD